jgi:hypothetical protein
MFVGESPSHFGNRLCHSGGGRNPGTLGIVLTLCPTPFGRLCEGRLDSGLRRNDKVGLTDREPRPRGIYLETRSAPGEAGTGTTCFAERTSPRFPQEKSRPMAGIPACIPIIPGLQ